jgi:hypothetical protein
VERAAAVSIRSTRWRMALSHLGSIIALVVTSACTSPDRATGPTSGPYIAIRPRGVRGPGGSAQVTASIS